MTVLATRLGFPPSFLRHLLSKGQENLFGWRFGGFSRVFFSNLGGRFSCSEGARNGCPSPNVALVVVDIRLFSAPWLFCRWVEYGEALFRFFFRLVGLVAVIALGHLLNSYSFASFQPLLVVVLSLQSGRVQSFGTNAVEGTKLFSSSSRKSFQLRRGEV